MARMGFRQLLVELRDGVAAPPATEEVKAQLRAPCSAITSVRSQLNPRGISTRGLVTDDDTS
jgi:hypothetical protein